MSIDALRWAMRLPLPTSGQKLLMIMLANYANEESGKAWPCRKTLAEDCRMSNRTISTHTQALEKMGLITIEKRHVIDRPYPNNVYLLHIGKVINPPPLRVIPSANISPSSKTRCKKRQNQVQIFPPNPQEPTTHLLGNVISNQSTEKSVIHDGFVPNESTRAYCHRAGCRPHTDDDVMSFVLKHKSKGDTSADWQAEFCAWRINLKRYDLQHHRNTTTGEHHGKTKQRPRTSGDIFADGVSGAFADDADTGQTYNGEVAAEV